VTSVMWFGITILVYLLARALHDRVRTQLVNPAIVTIVLIVVLLQVTATPYATYQRGGRLLSFWLGPGVVALGLPLAQQLGSLRRHALGIGIALVLGTLVGMVVAMGTATLLGASPLVVRSLAPRSVTSSIAIGISASVGGIPALSAIVSILSGALGGGIGVALLRAAGVRSRLATGLALGAAAHGFGTARAASEGDDEGAAAAVAMGTVGLLTALVAPMVVSILLS
jgi:predicted murein hydrolase (TIGR00659 family)